MAGPRTPQSAMQKKVEVEDEQKSAVYRSGTGFAPVREEKPFPRNIFFVGPRGSGKTTLGRLVAQKFGKAFVDTDELIVGSARQNGEESVAQGGWPAFRKRESEVLAEVCAGEGQVVATGGGIVCDAGNRALMRDNGTVFYLMAMVPTLLARLAKDPKADQRPPLTGLTPAEELVKTVNEREPLVMEIANFILQAEKPLEELVEDVAEKIAL